MPQHNPKQVILLFRFFVFEVRSLIRLFARLSPLQGLKRRRSGSTATRDEARPLVQSKYLPSKEGQGQRIALFLLPLILFLLSSLTLEAATRRYRLSWRDNPATTATIGFEHYQGSNVRLVYDTQDHGKNVAAYRFRATPTRNVNHAGMRNAFVRLTGLKPATFYYFLIVDSDGVSRRLKFETPHVDPNVPLSVIAGGDSRNNRQTATAANLLVSKIRPHFVLFGGDMTNGDTAAEWQQWFDDWQLTISSDGRLTPIVPARGNHERANTSIFNLFDTPHPEIYYSLEFAGGLLKTYTLNSLYPPGGNQLKWLTADLAASRATWKIAQYHHSMRPHTASKPERDELIALWATQFTRFGMDLVVESDVHTVKQTYPIRPSNEPGSSQGFIRDDQRGTVYVGEGCWGAPLRANNDDKPWTRSSGRFNQFKWIWVQPGGMQIRTVDIDRSRSARNEVAYDDRFRTPPGFYYWDADNTGDVLRIPRRALRPEGPPISPAKTRVVTGRPPSTPNIRPTPTAAPSGPAVISRDAAGRVRVGFQLRANGKPEIMVVDKRQKRLLWRKELPVRGPGPYSEMLQLPALPPNTEMELVVRANGQVLAKYVLR